MEDRATDQFVTAKLKNCLSLAQDLSSLLVQYSKAEDLHDTINLREYLSGIQAIECQIEEACVLKGTFSGTFSQETMALLEKTHENLRDLTGKFANLRDTNRLLRAVASVHLRRSLDEDVMTLQRTVAAVLRRLRRCKDIALLHGATSTTSRTADIPAAATSNHASLPFNPPIRSLQDVGRRNTATAALSVPFPHLHHLSFSFALPFVHSLLALTNSSSFSLNNKPVHEAGGWVTAKKPEPPKETKPRPPNLASRGLSEATLPSPAASRPSVPPPKYAMLSPAHADPLSKAFSKAIASPFAHNSYGNALQLDKYETERFLGTILWRGIIANFLLNP